MALHLAKTNGLFARTADGKLLFFATPIVRSAYVVPDHQNDDALRTLSKYWGLCELFSIAIIAPVALHFGALVLLTAFAIFATGSAIAYQVALRGMVSGLESVIYRPNAMEHCAVRLRELLSTVTEEVNTRLLWLCEAASIVPLASATLIIFNGHGMPHLVGGLLVVAFFGSATIAGACMISMKRSTAVRGIHSFAGRRAAVGS